MISDNVFGEADYGFSSDKENDTGEGDGVNDALWCQSASNESDIGTWIQPSGDTVTDYDNRDPFFPIYMNRSIAQVGLFRVYSVGSIHGFNMLQGLYQCLIPDEIGFSQTLVLWIGSQYTFSNIKSEYLIRLIYLFIY